MKSIWGSSLGLSLGLFVAGAGAGEVQWRSAAPRPSPVQTADQVAVVPPAAGAAASLGRPVPAATLDRPAPLRTAAAAPAVVDPHVRPTSFVLPPPVPPVVARGQSPEPPALPNVTSGAEDKKAEPPAKTDPEPLPTPRRVPQEVPQYGSFLTEPAPAIDYGPDGDCDGPFCGWWRGRGCAAGKFYASAEYLLWWIQDSHNPPLVTTGSERDRIPGALGQPGTRVLFGDANDNNARSGGRFTAGWWFGDNHCLGLEGSFLFLGSRSLNFAAASPGSPFLGRPFFDVLNNAENAEVVADSAGLAGSVRVGTSNNLWGAESNLLHNLCCGPCCHWDVLLGFRFLSFEENLRIDENLLVTRDTMRDGVLIPAGTGQLIFDRFQATNRFYGGQIGQVFEVRRGRWVLGLKTKVGLGSTNQTVHVGGGTTVRDPGGQSSSQPGGLLALASNSGRFSRDVFTVVPEVGLNIGYQLTPGIRLFAGYNFLYWSNVARPGEQIDRVVNTNQLPPPLPLNGPARPVFAFRGSDFYAHGVNFGLEFRY